MEPAVFTHARRPGRGLVEMSRAISQAAAAKKRDVFWL